MLRAVRRVLKPGGMLAFYVITTPPGLSTEQRDRAATLGPERVMSKSPYRTLLERAGFETKLVEDVTDAYRDTIEALAASWADEERELRSFLGDAEFEDVQNGLRDSRRGIDEGLLRRLLITAS